jgi:glutamate racemase
VNPRGPVGIFDSGVGGLTVARALLDLLPDERLLYVADTAHLPYGPRPPEQIRHFALQIIAFLVERGAKAVIMGCNTSSAVALEPARARYPIPIFGIIEPGARAALAATRGRVGVIATQATVLTGAYSQALDRLADSPVATREQACPAFVPLVEKGELTGPNVMAAATEYLAPLKDFGADTVVFGCTQYPFLQEAVGEIMGPDVALVDPALAVAQEAAQYFQGHGMLAPSPASGEHRFFASGDATDLMTTGSRFFGTPITRVDPVTVRD